MILTVLAAGMLRAASGLASPPVQDAPGATERGVAWLVQEVPRWSERNACFSCHHNGDGARALLAARAAGFAVPDEALAGTLAWLSTPDRWKEPGEGAPFRDTSLARLQFAAAARDAVRLGALGVEVRSRVARDLIGLQGAEGGWPVDTGGAPGSPITWGPTLATAQSWSLLGEVAGEEAQAARAQARDWLVRQRPQRVLDAAALLLGLAGLEAGEEVEAARRHAREVLDQARPAVGGFGPFPGAPPEVFDTAVVMLALAPHADESRVATTLQAARRHLLLQQDLDGSWPPTTRPRGAESEAHRMSTTAWAVLALLRVAEVQPGG